MRQGVRPTAPPVLLNPRDEAAGLTSTYKRRESQPMAHAEAEGPTRGVGQPRPTGQAGKGGETDQGERDSGDRATKRRVGSRV